MIFLIHYLRAKGKLVSIQPFQNDEMGLASEARIALEISMLDSEHDAEIVLLEAESEALLRKTHSRYFRSLQELKDEPGNSDS